MGLAARRGSHRRHQHSLRGKTRGPKTIPALGADAKSHRGMSRLSRQLSGFNAIAPVLVNDTRRIQIGNTIVQAVPLKVLFFKVIQSIKENPLTLLCQEDDCERCNAVRKFVGEISRPYHNKLLSFDHMQGISLSFEILQGKLSGIFGWYGAQLNTSR